MKSNLLKSIFISLILVMGVNNAWGVTFSGGEILVLKPNDNWKKDNARFAAYFFGNGEKWVSMSSVTINGTSGYYQVTAPTGGYTKVIFCRMNGGNQTNNWDNKWNQSGDLTYDGKKNVFTVPSGAWDGSTTGWGNQTITVTLNAQSGSGGTASVDVNYGEDERPTFTAPTRTGYDFGGFYTSTGGGGSQVINSSNTWQKNISNYVDANGRWIKNAACTLYAKWTEKTYSLTFKHDGNGTIKVGGTTVNSGGTASVNHVNTKTLVATANTGYNFSGWALSGSNTSAVTIGNTSAASTTIKATNTGATVTANFTPKTYAITLNANYTGGTNGSATATYNSNSVTNLTPPTRTDYRCNGYYTATSDGTLVLNTDGTLAKNVSGYTDANGNWIKDGTATLYAQWTYDVTEYTVTFAAGTDFTSYGSVTAYNNTTSASITSPATVRSGQSVTFTATPQTGYEVEGWYTNAACTAGKHDAGNTEYTTSITGTTNVYVKFVEKTWSVAFTAGTGGTVTTPSSTPQTVGEVQGINIIAETNTGYTFAGWTSSNGGKFDDTKAEKTKFYPTAATTVTATATENMSTLTTSNSYTEGNPEYAAPTASVNSIGIATTATVTATAAGNGYTFTGWTLTNCTRTDGGADDATFITVRSNGDGAAATVIANYEKIPPTTVYINPKTDWEETLKIICDGEEADMTPVGCDGYYTAEVPGGTTELKFGGNNETTLSLTIPQDDKVLYDMTSTNITKLYLKPNDNWKADGARFAAYFFGNGNKWVSMTAVAGQTDLYAVAIPTDKSYPSVIFCRMNPGTAANNFDNGTKWDQTGDLTIPNNGKNQCSINSGQWDCGENVTWDKVWDNSCWTDYSGPSNTYTVTLDRQGATTGTESVKATVGDAAPDVEIERTGYTFGGYYTEANGEGTQIIDAEGKWINGTNYVDADGNWISTDCNITFYAQWTEILSTITIYATPEEAGYVTIDGQPFTSGDTKQVGIETSVQVTAVPNDGYGIAAWGRTEGVIDLKGSNPVTITTYGSGEDGVLRANFIGLEYTITFDKQKGTEGTDKATVRYMNSTYSVNPVTIPTRADFTFGGYYSEEKGAGVRVVSAEGQWLANATDYTDADKKWLVKENTTLYAYWIGAPYTVTLDQTGAASQGTEKVTARYEADMPTADVTMPTAKNGYAFMGYWDEKEGKGTQYYDAEGASAHMWDKAEDATLYAYFAKAQITTINLDKTTFEPVEAGSTGFVTATPIIEPTPTGNTIICWRLLYSNGSEVEGRTATQVEGNTVKFSIAGLASGNYKIEAVLRTGNNCGSGTELSTKIVNFTIASTYTITVKYTCDGKEIMAATKTPAHVTEETEITAPDIPGYTFSKWVAGDGVTITDAQNGENTNETIKFTAIYDGYLTAQYTTKPMVYFKNTLGWEKVYVYTFSNNAWWNNGTGVHPNANKLEQGEMKLVEGTDDIYYFELTNTDGDYTQENNANNNYIAFSSVNYIDDNDYFKEGQAVYRGDHKNNLTLFIPQADQEPEKPTNTQTQYYSTGIWMKYNSTESGYQIPSNLPGGDWNTYTDNFTTTNPGGYTFSITKNLAANTEYKFKIRNYVWIHNDWEDNGNGKDNHQWFGYDGTITQSVSDLLFHDQNAEKKGYNDTKIKTTAAGEYIFTIDLSKGKVLLSVEYPVAVGDYRVIYTDNATWSQGTAHDANWYHPSRIIKENKTNETTKDIISFFISHGNNPTMKFQKVTSITNGNVTWEDAGAAKIPDNITTPGVYNFVIIQEPNGTSISMEEQAEPYTGNYYIRVDALAGKWDNYKTHSENRMTYSAFSESEANSFGEKFSHYATKYCTNGTNIKFTIANDYSPCISDTLAQDITNPLDNLDSEGTLLNNDIYSANVRFMWHHKTNKISRAYVGPAADKQSQFLMLRTKDEIQGATGELDPNEGDIVDAEKNVYAARFADTQNWIYERTIKVKPGTRVKLYASYPKVYHIYVQKTNWDQVALYAWKDSDHPLGDWPGTQPFGTVEIDGKTYYDFHVNEYVFGCQLILNNNGQGQQTDGDNAFKLATAAGNYYLTVDNQTLTEEKSEVFATEATAQYFRGAYDNNNETWDDNNSIVILGGSGTDWNTIRVIYDFKTNRLMAALVPDQEVSEEKIIAADVMIIRKHQENATCITLTNDNSKLTEVKTVYGSLQFNRWVLNNRDSEKSGIEYCTKKIDNQDTYDEEVTNEHHPILDPKDQKTIYERALYFISFPFDVHLSDVFGFGTYGTHWVISTYNGQRRAQNGYFVDNCMNEDCTNWDYIWDPSDFTMKANQGYLLSLDLDLMKYNNTDFWLHNIDQVELFFPSTADLKTIEKTNYQMPALTEDYECTINFNKVGPEDPTYNPVNDHRVRDSYWRCIGVPSFANYDGSLYKTEQDAENEENPINWKTNYTWQADNAAFPFLYEWNVTDNSLQVQNTSNFNFKATFAYLVQNGNSIYWSAVNAKPSNIVARSQEAKRNYDWKITIARNGEVEDQTFVRLTDHEKVTTEFDFNQDLSKEFNYGRSDIYTLIGYEKAAANSLPLSEQTTLIPLGLSIEYNGDYTIAMPDGTANIGVTLIDTESNTRTNLSAGMEYTLTLKKGDYNNRFFIEISPIQQTPTDIEYVENSHDDQARKVLIDNILYIVRDGQIFDARGARVK